MTTGAGVEISRGNPRVFMEVIDDGLSYLDPVVDECKTLVLSLSTDNGDACQRVEIGPNDLPNAVRLHLHFRLLGQHELCVKSDCCVWSRPFRVGIQDTVMVLLCIRSLCILAITFLINVHDWRYVLEVHVQDRGVYILNPLRIKLVIRCFQLIHQH